METHDSELDELYSEKIPEIDEGTILKGKIISIKPDSVIVDIGYKSEGFISIDEFTEKERVGLNEGDEIEVYVSRDRKSTRLNSSHTDISRMPSSA